jgi:hypothetical protein
MTCPLVCCHRAPCVTWRPESIWNRWDIALGRHPGKRIRKGIHSLFRPQPQSDGPSTEPLARLRLRKPRGIAAETATTRAEILTVFQLPPLHPLVGNGNGF